MLVFEGEVTRDGSQKSLQAFRTVVGLGDCDRCQLAVGLGGGFDRGPWGKLGAPRDGQFGHRRAGEWCFDRAAPVAHTAPRDAKYALLDGRHRGGLDGRLVKYELY